MRRIFVAIVGLMLLAAPAAASNGKEAAARAMEAAQALKQQAVEAAAAGRRLDFANGPASENLGRIFDTKAFAALPPAAATDMEWMLDWTGAVSMTNHTLMDFGADPKHTTQPDLAVITRNVHDYEDQITVAVVFQQGLFPRLLESSFAFLSSLPEKERTPVRLKGAEAMVENYLKNVSSALCFAGDTTLKPANARLIVAAVRAAADTWIEWTDDDTRKEFVALVTAGQQQTKDTETAAHFRAIKAALKAAKS